MVGGGQLARMTSQAATGLGIGFRVLAGDPGESAAQVVAGVVIRTRAKQSKRSSTEPS